MAARLHGLHGRGRTPPPAWPGPAAEVRARLKCNPGRLVPPLRPCQSSADSRTPPGHSLPQAPGNRPGSWGLIHQRLPGAGAKAKGPHLIPKAHPGAPARSPTSMQNHPASRAAWVLREGAAGGCPWLKCLPLYKTACRGTFSKSYPPPCELQWPVTAARKHFLYTSAAPLLLPPSVGFRQPRPPREAPAAQPSPQLHADEEAGPTRPTVYITPTEGFLP